MRGGAFREGDILMKVKLIFGCGAVAAALALVPAAAPAQSPVEALVRPPSEPAKEAATAVEVAAKSAPAHLFAIMAGSWSGGGTIDLTNDIHERLRCRANHSYGQANNSLSLSIRCASDNYKFELSSRVVERGGHVTGQWQETSYGVTGTISGRMSGNRVTAVATGDKFTADLSVVTNGNQQSVTITPKATYLQNVKIALSKAGGAPKAATATR
jgi:hypothetical protein